MSLEIFSWNILSGGFNDYGSLEQKPSRIDNLAKVIKNLNPDIISLVDTYRWTEVFSIDDLKKIFGFSTVYMVQLEDQRLKNKGHDNGITVLSKIPNTVMTPIWLATRNAIKSHLAGIDIFSVYFDDVSEDTRIKQVKAVLELINPDIPTIITGDFNTIDESDLNNVLINLDILAQKYPGPMKSMEKTLDEMKRAEITKVLKANDFKDFGKSAGYTVPAKLFPLAVEKPIIRLDYAFGNNLIRLEDFKVLTDEEFGNLSDHYPIWMRISQKDN